MTYLGRNPVGITSGAAFPIDDTAGEGDVTKVWSADKSHGEVSELKSAINYATETEPIAIAVAGKYLKITNNVVIVDDPQSSSSGFGYVIFPCSSGDVFTVNGVSSGNYPLAWVFTDSEYNVLDKAASNVTITNAEITAPEDTAYLIIHDKAPYRLSYKGKPVLPYIENLRTEISEYNVMNDNLLRYGEYTFPSAEIVQGTYKNTDGSINVVSNRIRYKGILILYKGDKLILEPGETANRVLYGYRYSSANSFSNASGSTEKVVIKAEAYMEVIPVFRKSNNGSISPSDYDGKITLYNYNYKAEEIDAIEAELSDIYEIKEDDIVQGTYSNQDGSVNPVTNRIRVEKIIKVTNGTAVTFTPGTNCERITIGYKGEKDEAFSQLYGEWFNSKKTILFGSDGDIVLVFAHTNNSSSITPSDYDAECVITKDYAIEKIPSSYPQEVGYRKSQQYTNLIWKPLANMPKAGGSFNSNNFVANTEYKGLLYSDAHTVDQRIGFDISMETFMTALHNPYSKLYTEDINASNSASAYGLTYNGDGLAGAFMGSACNLFVMSCLGGDIPYSSFEIGGWLKEQGVFETVYDQSANGIELMDVLSMSGHVALVTRIWTNARGVVSFVQVSEEFSPLARNVKIMSSDEFNTYLSTNNYTILRYKYLYKNIQYAQSPFVAIENETAEEYEYNDDICTFAGDKASFKENDLIYINYTKGNYNAVNIYKNDVLLESISLSADSSVHSLNLSTRGYTYGLYKACLTDGSTESECAHFEIINATATISNGVLTFSSENANPLYYGWVNSNNYSYKKIEFTSEDISSGQVETGEQPSSYSIMKVCYQGTYGRISIVAEET